MRAGLIVAAALAACSLQPIAAAAQSNLNEAFWVNRPATHSVARTNPIGDQRIARERERNNGRSTAKVTHASFTLPEQRTLPAPAATPSRTATKPSAATVAAGAPPSRRSIAEEMARGNSSPWAVAVGLTLLTLVPAMLLAMTPLVRLLVIFHFLRQALGTQTAPSNQVLMGLGLMMTWFLMQPVITQVEQQAVAPYRSGVISGEEALTRGAQPLRTFMLKYARDKDLELFASASQTTRMQHREDAPMQVVIPAYMISELKSGFQIGAILFLPFLLVDLVIASVTTSIGMLQMPPTVISTPVKILLFVMVDGWHLLASSLLHSF